MTSVRRYRHRHDLTLLHAVADRVIVLDVAR